MEEESQSLLHLSSSCTQSTLQSSQSIISTIKASINGHNRASAAAISSLSSIVANSTNEEGFSVISSVLNEDLVLSLASSQKYAVRSRILDLLVTIVEKWKGEYRILPDEVIIRGFLRFTSDIYPILRRNGIDGLCGVLSVSDYGVDFCVVELYERAVVLLKDDYDDVRSSAVRLAGLCGEIISQRDKGEDKSEQINKVFIQLCCMCRDMSMKVRLQSFKALGKMKHVSDNILIQSLSKKILGPKTGNKSIINSEKNKGFNKPYFSSAPGAFIHGIEDEFYQVRLEACKSLGNLALLSIKVADGALNLLIDMINDDYILVRLEALNSLNNMALCGFITLQDKYSDMFKGLLMESSAKIRSVAKKIIGLIKFPKFEKFKSIVNELIINLEKYPQEEEEIFFTLFSLGKNHTKFSLRLAKDISKQIEQLNKEDLILDKPGVSCTIILSISSSFHNNQLVSDTPAELFNYAVPLYNKISKALLNSTIDKDSLLSFLLGRCNMKFDNLVVKNENEMLDEEFRESVKLILNNVGFIWPLVKSCSDFDVQRVLRGSMEELEMLYLDEDNCTGAVIEFISEYIKIIQLISEIWYKIHSKISNSCNMKNLHILLEKLDASLRRIKFGFLNLNKEFEFQILELSLLSDLLKISMVKTNSVQISKNIHAKILDLEFFSCISGFIKEFKGSIDEKSGNQIKLYDLLNLFNIQELKFDNWEIKSIKAKLEAIGNNSENPILFISGLPVGIKFHIILYNISSNNKLWLKMDINGIFTQFVYLDLDQFEGSDKLREQKNIIIPFYQTPQAVSFEIRVCIVMECLSKDNELFKEIQGGPSYEVIELCDECIVYFVNMEKR